MLSRIWRWMMPGMILALLNAPGTTHACSAFLLSAGNSTVIGFNENWHPLPGMVVITPRGAAKVGLGFSDLIAPDGIARSRLRWTTKYGSVSFCFRGGIGVRL
jgi:hypothetical protein